MMIRQAGMVAAGLAFWLMVASAHAEVPLKGLFVAREACPATQSIRTQANPGNVMVEPARSYPMIAKNKPAASHYLIDVDGAEPRRRWVAVGCGEHVVEASGSGTGDGDASPGGSDAGYVLAISWQPAFCEGKPDKPECSTQTQDRFDASHFTLHGLWPQPRSNAFCNVAPDLVAADKNGDWDRLPEPGLSPAIRTALEKVMPGTMSKLERHEWIKHGTCFEGASADEYFAKAVALIDQVNASKVRDLFASRIGSQVQRQEIQEAFEASFGAGAGDRVRIACKRDGGRSLIVELTVGLAGEVGDEPSMADLIAKAKPTDPGCPGGIVDAVGLQ